MVDERGRVQRALSRAFGALVGAVPGGTYEERGAYAVARCRSIPIPGANGVTDHGIDEAAVLRDLDVAFAPILADGSTPWLVTFADRSARLQAAARGLGFEPDHENAGMLVTADAFRPRADVRASVEEARDDATLASANRLFAAGFGEPEDLLAPLYRRATLDRIAMRVWLVLAGDEPVSTAIGWHGDDALGVFAVATPARFRGRGYAGLATSAAVAAGFEDGAAFAFLQSSALGEPVYRRLGFRQVSTYRFLTRRAAVGPPHARPGR